MILDLLTTLIFNVRARWREWRHPPSLVEVINIEFERRR